MNSEQSQSGTRRSLTVIVVLLCLVALLQLGLLLQRHLARPTPLLSKASPSKIAWNPDDEIAAMHARINELFNQAFASPFPPQPPASMSSPRTSGGSAVSPLEDPIAHMRRMQHQIDALFNGAMAGQEGRRTRFDEGWAQLDITPGMSVRDAGDSYEVMIQLPGVDKSDIHIQLDHSVLGLVVEQNLRQSAVTGSGSTVQRSVHTSRFERHLRLPGATDRLEAVKAVYEHEVLHISIPKVVQPESTPAPIPVQ